MVCDITGCIVVNDVDALDRVLNGGPRTPILFTENGRDFIRVWPRAQKRADGRLLAWFRGVMAQQRGQTVNAV